jgi:uncharacterized RDD family membrane protein YckC
MNNDQTPTPVPQPEAEDPSKANYKAYRDLHIGPFTRYFARNFDVLLLGCLLSPLFAGIDNVYIMGWVVIFLWMLIEPIFLATFGSTPGKAILKIKVRKLNGEKPGLIGAYIRSFGVWIYGLGLVLPGIVFITQIYSFYRLSNKGSTKWDQDKFVVTHGKVGVARFTVLVLIAFLALALSRVVVQAVTLGELNSKLPVKIDSEVEMTHIDYSDKTWIYQYRLFNKEVKDIDIKEFTRERTDRMKSVLCTKPKMNELLESGATMQFEFTDKNGAKLTTLKIEKKDCE